MKIQRLDRVSCPDTEIQVLPNLGITVDQFSCPDTDIGVSGTICITCPILHEFVCIDLKCNGYVLVLIEVCRSKPFSHQNQKLTQHNSTTGKKVPPAHAKRVYLFLCLSVSLSVSKG